MTKTTTKAKTTAKDPLPPPRSSSLARQLGATSDAQFPDLRPHGLQCRRADGRVEATEQRLVP